MSRRSENDGFVRVQELATFDQQIASHLLTTPSCATSGSTWPVEFHSARRSAASTDRLSSTIHTNSSQPSNNSIVQSTISPTLAGFDEAGRGALAGPVVVGCVHFPFLTAGATAHAASELACPVEPYSTGDSDVGAIPRGTNHSMIQSLNGSILHSLAGLDDSKRLSVRQREKLLPQIKAHAVWGIGAASAEEIDTLGIVSAVSLAARRAYRAMGLNAALLLCDRGIRVLRDSASERLNHLTPQASDSSITQSPDSSIIQFPGLPLSQSLNHSITQSFNDSIPQSLNPSITQSTELSFTRGDSRSLHIAAASILAKVTRDRIMIELDQHFPGYEFAAHKGYGTTAHIAALRKLGPSSVHRRTFHAKSAVRSRD